MASSKRVWFWAATLLAAGLAGSLWVYDVVLARHHLRVTALFSKIEIGSTRPTVARLFEDFARTSGVRRVNMGAWEDYFVWGSYDWILILDYTNNIVEFAGIVSSDKLSVPAKGAPPWKRGAVEAPRLRD